MCMDTAGLGYDVAFAKRFLKQIGLMISLMNHSVLVASLQSSLSQFLLKRQIPCEAEFCFQFDCATWSMNGRKSGDLQDTGYHDPTRS